MVQMKSVVFLHKWTSSLVSSTVLLSRINLMMYESCTSTTAPGTVRWKSQLIFFSCWVAGAVGKDVLRSLTISGDLWKGLERTSVSRDIYARGEKCIGGTHSHCVWGVEYWIGRVLSNYAKLCFFLLILCGLKNFASACVLSPAV